MYGLQIEHYGVNGWVLVREHVLIVRCLVPPGDQLLHLHNKHRMNEYHRLMKSIIANSILQFWSCTWDTSCDGSSSCERNNSCLLDQRQHVD